MGKAGRWLKSFLAGGRKDAKRDRPHAEAMPVTALPGATPKEKRWSFRRPVVLAPDQPGRGSVRYEAADSVGASRSSATSEAGFDQKTRAVALAVATAAAADVAVAAAQAARTVVRLSSRKAAPHQPPPASFLVEAAAAVRIQAAYRGYLARTALCALRGIVKLQALVRGQLVRKQAKATLRCMQALLAAQTQLRAQRMRFLQEHQPHQTPPPRPRPSPQHPRHRRSSYEMDRSSEESAKIVEMDNGEQPARRGGVKGGDRHFSSVDYHHHHGGRWSPAPSAMTELSPRASSWHVEDHLSFGTAHSSPHSQTQNASAASELPFPSYMGNAEAARRRGRAGAAAEQEERGGAQERAEGRQDAAVVVAAAGWVRAAAVLLPAVVDVGEAGLVGRVAQGQRVRVHQLRAHRGHHRVHRVQPDPLARRIRGAQGPVLIILIFLPITAAMQCLSEKCLFFLGRKCFAV